MRFASPSLQCIAAAATSNATMYSPRVNARCRNPRRRGFCDRPPQDSQEGAGGLVSGDSHLRTVRDANHGFRQGQRGGAWVPSGPPRPPYGPRPRQGQRGGAWVPWGPPWPPYGPRPQTPYHAPPPYHVPPPPRSHGMPPPPAFRTPAPAFGPPQPAFHQPLLPRLADYYRNWNFAFSQPPPQCERFIMLSYNILADYLARDHRSKLYFHIPPYILDWEWRKKKLLLEFGLWAPDIMCLQMRTGNAVDGCAIFWRTNRFQLRHEEHIEFNKLGLRDNVAQICVLESRIQSRSEKELASLPASSDQSRQANQVVICNIHVLYNPKRGEIKLGQVRMLLDRAYAVSKIWNDAPVIICGDFNCTPKSPLYKFISENKISLYGLARDQVSGQYAASIYAPGSSGGPNLSRYRPPNVNSNDTANNIEQCTDTCSHCKHQNDIENANLTEKISSPQGQTGLLDFSLAPCSVSCHMDRNNTSHDVATSEIGGTEISNGQSVQSSSAECGPADPSESVRSCIQLKTNKEFSQSDPDVSYELIDNPQLGSSTENREISQGLLDSSSEMENKNTEVLVVSTSHKDFIGNETQKENTDDSWTSSTSTKNCSSDTVAEKSVLAETVLYNDADTEVSTLESMDNSSVTEKEKAGLVISCQSTCKSNQLDLSTCGDSEVDLTLLSLSLDKVGVKGREDKSSSENYDINSSGEIPAFIPNDASSSNTDNCNKSELADSAVSQFSMSSTVGPSKGQVEDNTGVSGNNILLDDICSSEENSDPNFFKELIGSEDFCRFGEVISPAGSGENQPSSGIRCLEMDPSAIEIQEDSLVTAPAAANLEKHSYNPYLWTPVEIEIASGNAECTTVEHNLKLRSAYVDVKDYAGTKDSSGEPQVTSYNRLFMGTVDYIWCSEDLQTVKVLDTIPKHVLQQTPGFPTKKWGSDHIALACQLAFTKDLKTK
ncbi:carbon catabolite repressor protein 4 homolog 6-like isoform X3 [Phoenix dactylifera]|uniref:Carbon catabolite repressor protein 4 homolog 6-like isoform X3 n=1 Tax=Phoenix dactylifera TaxID=42345 RepID=A0A8B8J757_PHODC|nr:carbon catabolite repressor protein 4 homolog 6-like isoform X3 [Phoenix dactylifera]